ncbi:hypothetical protein [Roseovarius salinarum]|uniref:hypothetical protein n=1 Tax=Roseovarius salinarum TaxID=1981892 RepID=UPI001E2D4C5C|nr:hypothetical protein [Roseovarius salinarum]
MSFPENTQLAVALVAAVSLIDPRIATAQDRDRHDGGWSVAVVAGQMTTNGIDEVLVPGKTDFADNGLAGLVVGYERPLRDMRWDLGVEFQLNQHFGQQEYQEFVVPATIRYSPRDPWVPAFDSFGFGIGMSYATETPRVEVATRGASQRGLLYFFLETAFALNDTGDSAFLRLHHRSDAYGLFATDTGSNALAVGVRRGF